MDFNIFTTQGRIGRLNYLVCMIAIYAFVLIAMAAGGMFGLVVAFGFQWPLYCIAVRRSKDMGLGTSFATLKVGLGILGAILTYNGSPFGALLGDLSLVMDLILLFAPSRRANLQ